MKIGASHITIYDVGANIRGFELTASFKHRCRHKNGSQGMVAANTICRRIPATSTKLIDSAMSKSSVVSIRKLIGKI